MNIIETVKRYLAKSKLIGKSELDIQVEGNEVYLMGLIRPNKL